MSQSDDAAATYRNWNDQVIEEFRAGKERIADMFDRSALLLLHTVGARTAQPRTSPVAYFRDGDRYLVVASAAGRDQHPSWYFNLVATPQVTAEVWTDDGIDEFEATAVTLEGDERDALWAELTAKAPGFADYQTRTSRVLPVVALQRETH
jgi:deazaflavin-dependent oxidoreductase (nitroreductase family)